MGKDKTKIKGTDLLVPELKNEFDLVIVGLDKTEFEGKAAYVIAPSKMGNIAILGGHTPVYSILTKGTVVIGFKDNKTKEIQIEGGLCKATQFKTTILAEFGDSKFDTDIKH